MTGGPTQLPGLPSLLFLAFVLIVMPWGAWRTARRLRGETSQLEVTREQYWRGAVLTQLMLLVLAWLTGSSFGFRLLAIDTLRIQDMAWTAAALALCLALRAASRAVRSEEELRALEVYRRAPRTGVERVWFTGAALAASVAEEAAYRGVGWSIVWYMTGSAWLATLLMAVAFTLAHWNQGWKSGVTIFLFALVLHGLVSVTGTLAYAMVVHAVYDFVVGGQIRRRALQYDAEVWARG